LPAGSPLVYAMAHRGALNRLAKVEHEPR
jgi:hypothetical protein